MTFWLSVALFAFAVLCGVVALLHPDGLAGLLVLLASRRALFLVSLLATGVVSGLFVGTELGQLRGQTIRTALAVPAFASLVLAALLDGG